MGDGVTLESLLPIRVGDGGCDLVVISDLETIRAPEHREVSSGRYLSYPP
jgi:hypothetical protein